MHIPDGYLSPSSCAALYAAAAPFWYVGLKRVRKAMHARAVPILGLFAAFCFVIMMFNLPLPGGTTGHAVGIGIATIVLGPWVSIVAVSMALFVQALFFGDGGLTTFGANCFNMAVVGSLTAYVAYRAIAGCSSLLSKRRVVAAGIAGYAAINLSALFAAIEFGVQPMLFHDASGMPLYAPYPLSIAVPAMMIGHLTIAGLAELTISAGIVAYIQRTDPGLLLATAPAKLSSLDPVPTQQPTTAQLRRLWLLLGLALTLTPLGIVAVGTAWGEWKASDFNSTGARHEIAAASRNAVPPARAPRGLEHLSSLWRAPLPGYAPGFIRTAAFGYFISASVGVGMLVLLSLVLTRVSYKRVAPPKEKKSRRTAFIERTMQKLLATVEDSLFAEDVAASPGFLQSLDARVKLAGISALLISAIAVRQVLILVVLFAAATILGVLSHVRLARIAKHVWLSVLAFTGTIAVPALLVVKGTPLVHVPLLGWPISEQAVVSVALLILRAETCATLAFLLVLCTSWNRLLRALRWFRVPASVTFIIEMTYRYLFLLIQSAQDMIESRRARLVGVIHPAEQRRMAAAMGAVLLDKSLHLSSEVVAAMEARGYRGDVHLLNDRALKADDWFRVLAFVAIAAAAIWVGR